MTTAEEAQKKRRSGKRKASASGKQKKTEQAPEANGGLTGKQVLALWELILTGDGKTASKRRVRLAPSETQGLVSARLVSIESGPRKKTPTWGAKLHLADEAWEWANQGGLKARLSPTKAAVPVLAALLGKLGGYLKTHDLALDHFLRPRREETETEPGGAVPSAVDERTDATPREAAPIALEERIRAAYLRVTGGALNEYVRLALLRTELPGEPREAVDAELRAMQQQGGAVLYPIDDPQRLRPEDAAAALQVSGERRDLLCIKR